MYIPCFLDGVDRYVLDLVDVWYNLDLILLLLSQEESGVLGSGFFHIIVSEPICLSYLPGLFLSIWEPEDSVYTHLQLLYLLYYDSKMLLFFFIPHWDDTFTPLGLSFASVSTGVCMSVFELPCSVL